jgi:cardiolipin synthase
MKNKTRGVWISVCVLALVFAGSPSRAARDRGVVWITAQVAPLVDTDYYAASHAELLQAKKSIRCALYLAKYSPEYPKGFEAMLLGDLISAHNRGVDVSVILDGNDRPWEDGGKKQEDKKNQSAFDLLEAAGVDVRYDSNDRLLHSKLVIIDESVTILGSTNWTYSALKKNHEASVVIRSSEVARTFLEGIQKIKMVAGGKEKR